MTSSALEALLAVQELDTSIDQRRHARATLPERAEIDSLLARSARLAEQLAQVTVRRDEIASRQAGAEEELASTEARSADISRRLYGGSVSASRDLQAMADEIESLATRASGLEEHVLEEMELREPLDAELVAGGVEIESLGARVAQLRVSLAGAEAGVDDELAVLAERRSQAAQLVPAPLLATYDGLRRRLGGVGAARLVAGRCGGCHLSIPATDADRIRHHPDELSYCEQCGRILVG